MLHGARLAPASVPQQGNSQAPPSHMPAEHRPEAAWPVFCCGKLPLWRISLWGVVCAQGCALRALLSCSWSTVTLTAYPCLSPAQSRVCAAVSVPASALAKVCLGFVELSSFYADMLQVSLVLGELVSPKGGSAGRDKTCQGTSHLCPPWKRAVWASVGFAVNLCCWASRDLHHLQTCLSKCWGFGLRNSQQIELPRQRTTCCSWSVCRPFDFCPPDISWLVFALFVFSAVVTGALVMDAFAAVTGWVPEMLPLVFHNCFYHSVLLLLLKMNSCLYLHFVKKHGSGWNDFLKCAAFCF